MNHPTNPAKRVALPWLACLLAIAVILGACGAGDDNVEAGSAAAGTSEIASIDTTTESDTSAEGSSAGADQDTNSDASQNTSEGDDPDAVEAPDNPEDAGALFNDCMKAAGFDFGSMGGQEGGGIAIVGGDPDEDAPQATSFSMEEGDFEAFEEANTECEKHLANVDQGFDMSPEEEAAFDDAQLAFTKCMTDQGFDFGSGEGGADGIMLEVEVEGELDPQTGQPSQDDVEFEALNEAAEICDQAFQDALPEDFGENNG